MFGYFKLDKECPKKIFLQYRKYYCFLCRAIGKHYGPISRFTLSYDVAFLAVLASDEVLLNNISKIHCLKNEKALSDVINNDISKKIATVNVLLSAVKLEDDILDDNSIKAKLIYHILERAIKKAKKNYNDMWQIIDQGYSRIRGLEKGNATLETIENAFSDMICSVVENCFEIKDERKIVILSSISKWLYFIDAVDDLDENVAKGTFNPFLKYGSFKNLKLKYNTEILQHYYSLFERLSIDKKCIGTNNDVIDRIVFWGIPEMTVKVLTKGCYEK